MELNEKLYLQYKYFIWLVKSRATFLRNQPTRHNNTRGHLLNNYCMVDSVLNIPQASSLSVLSGLLGGFRNSILTRAWMEDHSVSAWRLAEGASEVRVMFSVSLLKCTLHRDMSEEGLKVLSYWVVVFNLFCDAYYFAYLMKAVESISGKMLMHTDM